MNDMNEQNISKSQKKTVLPKKLLFAAIFVLCIILDRVTKYAASSFFEKEWDSVTAIPGVLNFTYVLNKGAVAGILADNRWVFMSISCVAVAALAVYLAASKKVGALLGASLSMVAGGGVGNLIDRFESGRVVDFIDVTAVNFFPFNCIFNVADIFVCVGCCMIIAALIADEIKEARAKKAKSKESADGRENEVIGK